MSIQDLVDAVLTLLIFKYALIGAAGVAAVVLAVRWLRRKKKG